MSIPHGFIERLAELARSGVPFVSVTLVEAVGSTPQDAGSKMLVTAGGLVTGTVGGGKVEFKAIEHAQAMLGKPVGQAPPTELLHWNLKRDVGMTCGGSVQLFFETYNHSDWRIVVFGAGHVAQAVIHCLRQMDCHITCIDPRADWLGRIPESSRIRTICADDARKFVQELPGDAFAVLMTMGHATDRPILEAICRQPKSFPFVGVIGSKSKRAVLIKELTEAGIPEQRAEAFHCPLGLPLGTNQPGEIAVSVVGQLIEERDRWRLETKKAPASAKPAGA